MASTTTLTDDLRDRLTTAGLKPWQVAHTVNLLPPAGQDWLAEQLRDNPDFAFTRLLAAWIGDTADNLRTTHADAQTILRMFRTVPR